MNVQWEQISVPLHMGRVHTRVGGCPSAPPVVFVHGFVLAGDYMMPAANRLSPFARIYVPDLPGYGLSDRPPHLDLHHLGDCLAEWMQQLKLSRAHFIANSFGCQILVDFAIRYSELVQRLVLQGPTIDPAARSLGTQVLRLMKNSRIESPGLGRLMLRDYWRAGWRGIAATVLTRPLGVIERLSRQPDAYDLVILDQTMPGITGISLARELAAARPGLPVILYTGHSERITPRDLEAAGVCALVHKPVEPDVLYGLLKTHLR